MITGNTAPSSSPFKWSELLSRICEFLFALLLLVVLLPLFIVIGAAVRLESKGPVIFKQQRGGKDGRHFTIYKFRTMYDNPEKRNDLIKVLKTDSRITKVGHILRKTSLDELPQLFNILKGDMAFVGPRPALTTHTDNYNDHQRKRLSVRPGVTGLAQVSGRNLLTWNEKIELDLEYISKKTVWFDCYIILLTFVKVLKSEDVYGEAKK